MRPTSTFAFVLLFSLATACGQSERATPPSAEPDRAVEVTARGLKLFGPDTIPSGWTTIRFENESVMTHFALLEKLPEGVGLAEQQKEVAPIFQQGMDLLNEGQTDAAMAKFGELPEWFGTVVFIGGPGLTAAGRSSEASLYLDPGTYLLECYVKTNGVFHSYNPAPDAFGMVHQLTVTAEAGAESEPTPTLEITLSSARGIEITGAPVAGANMVAVHFEDQKPYENFVGHDVHVARLTDDTDLDELAAWMDWRQPDGLETPAPAEFLGGLNEMPAGATGYFSVTLEPGRYAWIAEVPDAADKGMLKIFTVTAP